MRKIGALALAGALLSAQARAQPTAGAAADEGPAPCSDEAAMGQASEAAEAQSRPGIGTIALKDTLTTLGAPLHWSGKDWLVFGGIAAGVAAVGFAFDIPMRDKTQAHQTSTLDELTKVVEPFGAGYSWAIP